MYWLRESLISPPTSPPLNTDDAANLWNSDGCHHASMDPKVFTATEVQLGAILERDNQISALKASLATSHKEIEALRQKVAQLERSADRRYPSRKRKPSISAGEEKVVAAVQKSHSRYWTPDEHKKFIYALKTFGPRDIKGIAAHVGTRNPTQVRTHAQKYWIKIKRERVRAEEGTGGKVKVEGGDGDLDDMDGDGDIQRAIAEMCSQGQSMDASEGEEESAYSSDDQMDCLKPATPSGKQRTGVKAESQGKVVQSSRKKGGRRQGPTHASTMGILQTILCEEAAAATGPVPTKQQPPTTSQPLARSSSSSGPSTPSPVSHPPATLHHHTTLAGSDTSPQNDWECVTGTTSGWDSVTTVGTGTTSNSGIGSSPDASLHQQDDSVDPLSFLSEEMGLFDGGGGGHDISSHNRPPTQAQESPLRAPKGPIVRIKQEYSPIVTCSGMSDDRSQNNNNGGNSSGFFALRAPSGVSIVHTGFSDDGRGSFFLEPMLSAAVQASMKKSWSSGSLNGLTAMMGRSWTNTSINLASS